MVATTSANQALKWGAQKAFHSFQRPSQLPVLKDQFNPSHASSVLILFGRNGLEKLVKLIIIGPVTIAFRVVNPGINQREGCIQPAKHPCKRRVPRVFSSCIMYLGPSPCYLVWAC